MVEKLNLKTIFLPHSYKLCELQSGSKINVNKRILVSFSIGSYEDEIWCEVAPIDACHILLGRP